jgi:hypothetical protein
MASSSRCCRSKAGALQLDGTEYEAFNTSGGLGTLCETLGPVRTLDYKTVRYPGHRDLMKLLLEDLALARRPGKAQGHHAQEHAGHHAGRGAGVRHRQRHEANGQLVQEVFARKIFADRNEGAAVPGAPCPHRAGAS